MAFLLDTSVAILLRDGDPATLEKTIPLGDNLLLSIVSRVELEGGVYRDRAEVGVRRTRLDALLATVPTIPFDDAAADEYRAIVAQAGYSRRKVLDRMIAAQALAHRATLVTMNAGDFADVPNLQLLGW